MRYTHCACVSNLTNFDLFARNLGNNSVFGRNC